MPSPPPPTGSADSIAPADDLVGLFTAVAADAPERPALTDGETELTYRELDAWSTAVAEALRAHGIGTGDRVALRTAPDAVAVVSILGILKAGAAYVPLDTRHPASRKEFILADCAACALIGEPGEGGLGGVRTVFDAEQIRRLRARPGDPNPPTAAPGPSTPGPRATAYVIYTSGTTGAPKGVPVRHGHVVALLRGARSVFDFGREDRWLLFHSLAFDFSVWEIWGALTTGARLVVMSSWTARNPEHILDVLVTQGVTVLDQTPTAFAALARAALAAGRELPALRYVIFGGEKVTSALLQPWAKRYGLEKPVLVNGYGITETTVFTTFHEIGEADLLRGESAIGTALPGFALRVVDESGRDLPPGRTGELWLAGPQVTEGYLNRPELTAQRFVEAVDPDSGERMTFYRSGDLVTQTSYGELVYTGRADLQVKLRGYRIELSEIEAAVRRHPGVADAVVLVREFRPGDPRLVCAFTAAHGTAAITAAQLREHIKDLLPSYMFPARYRQVDALAQTVNGKVDRAAIARLWDDETNAKGSTP